MFRIETIAGRNDHSDRIIQRVANASGAFNVRIRASLSCVGDLGVIMIDLKTAKIAVKTAIGTGNEQH